LQEVCHCSSKTIAKSKNTSTERPVRTPYDRTKYVHGGESNTYSALFEQAQKFYMESQFSCFYSQIMVNKDGGVERIPTLKLFAPQEEVWKEYSTKYPYGVGRSSFLSSKCKPKNLKFSEFEKCMCVYYQLQYLGYCPHCRQGWKCFRFLNESLFNGLVKDKLCERSQNIISIGKYFQVCSVIYFVNFDSHYKIQQNHTVFTI
jgi:hypothetical protein